MKNRHELFVDLLCIMFGIGSWLCVNGLWVELPLLVKALPEGWSLPSFMTIIIQLANLGPIIYTILHYMLPNTVTEKRAIYTVCGLAIAALLLLSQFWSQTTRLAGVDYSLTFFGLVLILAAVDCSSRVLYLPFMAKFKPQYLTCFFIGEGLSGFVPSIFAIIQGAGSGAPEECIKNSTEVVLYGNGTVVWNGGGSTELLFSIQVFIYLMVGVTVLSGIAFYLLNKDSIVSICLAQKIPVSFQEMERKDLLLDNKPKQFYKSTEDGEIVWGGETPLDNVVNTDSYPVPVPQSNLSISNLTIPKSEAVSLMILMTIISSLANGVFPSIQSYSCLPYGNNTYHWTVTLSSMANPTVCFLMLFLKKPLRRMLVAGAFMSFAIGGYVLYTALQSPDPPFVESIEGQIILVTSWILLVSLFTYVKVSIATIMRIIGKRGLFWTGVFTQFGSSIGAIIAFLVVNFTTVFQSYNPCP